MNNLAFKKQLEMQLTANALDFVSNSVIDAVRNCIQQQNNPSSLAFVLTGLEEARFNVVNPEGYKTIMRFISNWTAVSREMNDDRSPKLNAQGNWVMKKAKGRIAKLFDKHNIVGFNEDMTGTETKPLYDALLVKFEEDLENRDFDEAVGEVPSIFHPYRGEKEAHQIELKKKAKKRWDNDGRYKHAQKAKDMGVDFTSYILAVCKVYNKPFQEALEDLTEVIRKPQI